MKKGRMKFFLFLKLIIVIEVSGIKPRQTKNQILLISNIYIFVSKGFVRNFSLIPNSKKGCNEKITNPITRKTLLRWYKGKAKTD